MESPAEKKAPLSVVTAAALNTPPPAAEPLGKRKTPKSGIRRALAAVSSPFTKAFSSKSLDTPAKRAVEAVDAAEDAAAEFWRIAAEAAAGLPKALPDVPEEEAQAEVEEVPEPEADKENVAEPAEPLEPLGQEEEREEGREEGEEEDPNLPRFSRAETDVMLAQAAHQQQSELRVLQQALARADERCEQLEQREQAFSATVDLLTSRMEQFEQQHKAQLTEAKCRVAETDLQLHASRTKVAELEGLQGRVEDLEAQLRDKDALLAAEEDRRAAEVQAMRQHMREKATKQFQEAQVAFDATHASLVQAKTDLKAALARRAEGDAALARAEAARAEAEAAAEAARHQAGDAQRKVALEVARAEAAHVHTTAAQTALAENAQALEEAQAQAAAAAEQARQLEQQLAAATEESAALKVRLFDLTSTAAASQLTAAEEAALREQLQTATDMCEELMALAESS